MPTEEFGREKSSGNVPIPEDSSDQNNVMADALRELRQQVERLTQASASQSEKIESLKEDILLNTADPAEATQQDDSPTDSLLDIDGTLNNVLDSSAVPNDKAETPVSVRPDLGSQTAFLESLTQAFIPTVKKSPAIEEKIAKLIDNMLTGDLSPDTVKERAEKYPAPENCEFLTLTTVNAEIWDLMSRTTRSVDLAFQRTQEMLLPGLSALSVLAGRLVSAIQQGETPETRAILDQVMDSIALFSHANWKLNMKRRELIKPDLNPPYTRLCKEDIRPSTKLFGEDLSKQLKDMAEARKVGQQMQRPTSLRGATGQPSSAGKGYNPRSQGRPKPYERSSSTVTKRSFLGHGRASPQMNFQNQKRKSAFFSRKNQ